MFDAVTTTPNYCFRLKDSFLGFQNLLIAIGALVMMPMLTGLDPNVALFTAGLGTLLFQLITKGKVPVFLGSSFAFIAPILYGVQMWGIPATLSGIAAGGAAYLLMATIFRVGGISAIERLLPPIVTGPVITGIGLILAPVAVNMASGRTGDGAIQLFPLEQAYILSGVAFFVALLTRLFGRGWFQLIPIVSGVLAGYLVALLLGVIDWTPVTEAPWFQVPNFVAPTWHWGAVFLIFPIALVSAVEHVGDVLAISEITKRQYVREPGLHRTLMGDGLATTLAGCLGGPPNTTYSEVTAGVALTKTFNPAIMTWSACIAIALAFIAKVGIFLQTIPTPVMGGMMMMLFGTIAVIGINILVQAKVDLMCPRAMTIVGIILVIPVGGFAISVGSFQLDGIGLGGVLGVILNLVLPQPRQASIPAG